MFHFEYYLTEEELIRYYEFQMKNEPSTKKQQNLILAWVPGSALILGVGFKFNWIGWVIALFLSLLWVFVLASFVFDDVVKTSVKRKMKKDGIRLTKNDFKEKDGVFYYNREPVEIKGYAAYLDLFILALSNQEVLILPERIFNGDKEKMTETLKLIMTSVKKTDAE